MRTVINRYLHILPSVNPYSACYASTMRLITTIMTTMMKFMIASRSPFSHCLRYCRAARQCTSECTRQGCERIEEGHPNRTDGRPTLSCSGFPSTCIQVQAFTSRLANHDAKLESYHIRQFRNIFEIYVHISHFFAIQLREDPIEEMRHVFF